MCLKTRIASLHVLSLYPGEPQLKLARQASIQEFINEFSELTPILAKELSEEIGGIKSVWNKKTTLDDRKKELKDQRDKVANLLSDIAGQGVESIEYVNKKLLEHDCPQRILMEIADGLVVGARQSF